MNDKYNLLKPYIYNYRDIKGYIYNILTDVDVPIREVHIIIENKQYIVLLAGTEITSNDFIEELLSTVKYN